MMFTVSSKTKTYLNNQNNNALVCPKGRQSGQSNALGQQALIVFYIGRICSLWLLKYRNGLLCCGIFCSVTTGNVQ